jgi:hypothetical protein
MKYQRKWNCAECDQPVLYDSETDVISCGCGEVKDAIRDGKMKVEDLGNFRSLESMTEFTKPLKPRDPKEYANIHEKMLEDAEKRLTRLYALPDEHKDWDIIRRAEQDVENLKRLVRQESKVRRVRK